MSVNGVKNANEKTLENLCNKDTRFSIICNILGHAAERKEKSGKDSSSQNSNHAPSAIRADVLSN